MTDELERLALAADLALPMPWEKSASEVPYAHKQAFHDAANPQTVLALLEVCKAASDRPEILDAALMWADGSELHPRFERWVAALRSALAALSPDAGREP